MQNNNLFTVLNILYRFILINHKLLKAYFRIKTILTLFY